MNTYFCDREQVHQNYDFPGVGERLTIKEVEYQVLRKDWAGSYDYHTELAPVSRLSEYLN